MQRSFFAVILAVLASALVFAQERPMTNADVIKLLKAKLDDDVIVSAIDHARQRDFDRSADALLALKQAGASPAVLKAFLNDSGPATPSPPTASSSSTRAPGVYLEHSVTDLQPLEPTAVEQVKTKGGLAASFSWGLKKMSAVIVVAGAAARLRVDPQPVFQFDFDQKAGTFGNAFGAWMAEASSPEEFVLVEMTPDQRANERDLEVGQFNAYSQNSGVQSKDRVEIVSERLAPGVFRVTTVQRLNAGEFCFFYARGAALGAGMTAKIFDFGVN